VVCGDFVEKIEQQPTDDEADLVVGEDVEEWYDLVDVLFDPAPGFRFVDRLLGGVLFHRLRDCFVGEKCLSDETLLRQLEPVDTGAWAVERAKSDSACAPTYENAAR